jgi:hypothetical protein
LKIRKDYTQESTESFFLLEMNAYVTLGWDITCSGEKTRLSNTMVFHSFMSLQVPNLLLLVISSTPTLMSPSVYWTRKSSKTRLCLYQTYPLLNLRAAKNKLEASLKIKWMSPFSFSSGRTCWQVVVNDTGKTTSWAFHDPSFRMGGNVGSWSIWWMELQWNWVVKDDARTTNISYLLLVTNDWRKFQLSIFCLRKSVLFAQYLTI